MGQPEKKRENSYISGPAGRKLLVFNFLNTIWHGKWHGIFFSKSALCFCFEEHKTDRHATEDLNMAL